jgi:hypothetical protein
MHLVNAKHLAFFASYSRLQQPALVHQLWLKDRGRWLKLLNPDLLAIHIEKIPFHSYLTTDLGCVIFSTRIVTGIQNPPPQ